MADFEERTEQATPRRRQKAREKGQVARSRDLSGIAGMGAVLLAFWFGGGYFIESVKGMMARLLILAYGTDPYTVLRAASVETMVLILPFLCFTLVIAVGASVAQGGVLLRPLQMELDKLNPINGLQRLFSLPGFTDLLKSLFKFTVGGFLLYYVLKKMLPSFPGLMALPVRDLSSQTGTLVLRAVAYGFACFFILAVADYFLERWRFERSIRMSRVEVQDEHKESEGNPLIKQRIRTVQREIARRRMMQEVPKATVVITNPTHLAVALRYEDTKMTAPLVVAKGAGVIAEKIKEVARRHSVPIVEDKPLARILFKVDIDTCIPEELYRAVARILAHLYKLKGATA